MLFSFRGQATHASAVSLARTLGLTRRTTVAHQPSPSRWLHLGAAVLAGIALYQLFVVVLNGYLAAVAVPRPYFMWFGKPRQELALAVIQLACAVPVFLLVSGGVLAVCRALRSRSTPFLAAILVGMLLCYLYWAVGFVVFLPASLPPEAEPYPMSVRFQQLIIVPWWALPTVAAPWLGFGFSSWLLRRRGEA